MLCSMLRYAHFLNNQKKSSLFPGCFANEVWKDLIKQFEDKLPAHSKQDWLKTMEYQLLLSDVMMCKAFHITLYMGSLRTEAVIHIWCYA